MARILAVANQKGGVGKTTTAVNLAASLALLGQRVLLVDLDPQANATSGLGIEPDEETPTVYELLLGGARPREVLLGTEVSGLEAIPSAPRLFGAEVELVGLEGREFILRRSLDELAPYFGFVLIDCPPSLGLLTLNALVAAHSVLIPMQCEYYALEGLSRLLQTIRLIQESLNPDLTVEGVLLTMYDGRLTLSQQVADEARRFFGDKVFRTVIPRNVRLGEAPSFGKPAVLYDPKCAGARSYRDLAEEVIGNATQSARKGFEGAHP